MFVAFVMLLSLTALLVCSDNDISSADQENTINIHYGEGLGGESERNVKYGDKITELSTCTAPTVKIFNGWKTEDGLRVINGTSYIFDRDIEFKEIFSAKKFVVYGRD